MEGSRQNTRFDECRRYLLLNTWERKKSNSRCTQPYHKIVFLRERRDAIKINTLGLRAHAHTRTNITRQFILKMTVKKGIYQEVFRGRKWVLATGGYIYIQSVQLFLLFLPGFLSIFKNHVYKTLIACQILSFCTIRVVAYALLIRWYLWKKKKKNDSCDEWIHFNVLCSKKCYSVFYTDFYCHETW